jgi:hypothetical protein
LAGNANYPKALFNGNGKPENDLNGTPAGNEREASENSAGNYREDLFCQSNNNKINNVT